MSCSCQNSTGVGVTYGGCAGDRACCACPKGDKGDQGIQGLPGVQGEPGPTVVSADSGNLVVLGTDQFLFLDSTIICSAGFINSVVDSGTVDFTKTGCSLTAVVKRSNDPGNQVQLRSDGVYVPTPALPTREYIEDILANTFPQFVYDDPSNSYTIASVPTTAFTGWTTGCGLTGLATPGSPLAVNRADLFGTTAQTSLEAGPGSCDLAVKVDGSTVKRLSSGALTVDFATIPASTVRTLLSGTGIISYNPTTGVITTTAGANGSVPTSNAGSVSWQLPIVPLSGAGTLVASGSGIVDVDPDITRGVEILSNKVAAKIGDGLKFDSSGNIALRIDPASCCVSVGPSGLLVKKEPNPIPVMMCANGIAYSVIISQDCDGIVTGISYVNMNTGLATHTAPSGLGTCERFASTHPAPETGLMVPVNTGQVLVSDGVGGVTWMQAPPNIGAIGNLSDLPSFTLLQSGSPVVGSYYGKYFIYGTGSGGGSPRDVMGRFTVSGAGVAGAIEFSGVNDSAHGFVGLANGDVVGTFVAKVGSTFYDGPVVLSGTNKVALNGTYASLAAGDYVTISLHYFVGISV